jgi:hypothetical protein
MAHYQNDFIRSQKMIFDQMVKESNTQANNKILKRVPDEKINNAAGLFLDSLDEIFSQIEYAGQTFDSIDATGQVTIGYYEKQGLSFYKILRDLKEKLSKTNNNFKTKLINECDNTPVNISEDMKKKIMSIQEVYDNNLNNLDFTRFYQEFSGIPSINIVLGELPKLIFDLIINFNRYVQTSNLYSIQPINRMPYLSHFLEGAGSLYSQSGGIRSGGTIYDDPNFRLNPMKRFS